MLLPAVRVFFQRLCQPFALQCCRPQLIDDQFKLLLGFAVELQRGVDVTRHGCWIGTKQILRSGQLHAGGIRLLLDGVMQIAGETVTFFHAGEFVAGM